MPQLIERCQSDIKSFFEHEVRHNMPLEDLKEISKAIEKVPIVEMKYSIADSNLQEEILTGQPLREGKEAIVMVNLKRTNSSNQ